MGNKSSETNPKVRATSAIWGCAIGLLGVCITLVAIRESGIILPLLVVLGAGGGTAALWFSPDKRQQEEVELARCMKALEERVMNLEIIYTSLPDTTKPFFVADKQDHL
ncbi:hypothetical protein RintRC_1670 [Richelia intracellularis]|nr:hypothetical protein RintRC_3763 [Richelia intracellularis]CDN12376.1 hypothetical protein RintRC_1670 [Richelia intracellularis]